MKKAIVVILIFAMAFCAFGCGNKEKFEPQYLYTTEDGIEVYIDENGNFIDADGNMLDINEIAPGQDIEGEDIEDENIESGDIEGEKQYIEYEELGVEYDFKLSYNTEFPMDSAIEKTDYSDIKGLESKVSEALKKAVKAVYKINLKTETEYIEDTDYESIGAYGFENEDDTAKTFEAGVYRNDEAKSKGHYLTYSSGCYYNVYDSSINDALADFGNYGVTVDREKLKTAAQRILNTSPEQIFDTYYCQAEEFDNGKVSDYISISVNGFYLEEKPCWYIGVEIDRIYE